MRKELMAVVAFAVAGLPVAALADRPGPDWIPLEDMVQKLKAAGYTEIWELAADDGHWEGEGMKDGKALEFHADPRTGALTSEKPD